MILSLFKAEDKSLWGDFWFNPVGLQSLSGMRVTPDSAMQLSVVYRAIALLSGHMAMLPIVFYQSGTRKRVQHPLLKLLNHRPNRWQNAFEWREMKQGHIELRGNCYNEIYFNARGEITELIPRHPDRVKVVMQDSGDYNYRVINPDNTERTVARENMWHERGLSSNGITGMAVIECARESFGSGIAAQSYGTRFFANDAKPQGGWIEHPSNFKDKPTRDAFRSSFQESQSGSNRGKVAIFEYGMKYHEVGVSNQDAQFLETRKFSVSDIARWFGIPPHKLGDLDRATFSNIEQQALEYVQDALQPRATRSESSIEAELLLDDEEIDVEYDFSELLRGDSAARAKYIHTLVLDGVLTRNEGREIEGREPLEGLDEPLRPLNMVENDDAEELENELTDKETPNGEPKKEDEATPKDNQARLNALLNGNADRLARRFIKSKQLDPELIASGLSVPLATANDFCVTHSLVDLDETKLRAALRQLF